MSTQMVQFDRSSMPASLSNIFGGVNSEDLTAGAEAAFPVLSIKGKVWRVTHGGEQRILQRDGEPMPSIDVVIVMSNRNLSKLYYKKAYQEGDDSAPDCSSANGIAPDAGIQTPQSTGCALCPHNVWGSKITEQGKKTKSCGDTRRIALIPERDMQCKAWGAPLLLRIPAGSFQALTEFARTSLSGADYCKVVTRLGFDMNVAYPKLTFRPLRWVTDAEAAIIGQWRSDPIVNRITGMDADPSAPNTQQRVIIPIHQVAPQVAPEAMSYIAGAALGSQNTLAEVVPNSGARAAPPTAQVIDIFADSPAPAPTVKQYNVGGPHPISVETSAPAFDPCAGLPEHLRAAVVAVGGPDTAAGKAIIATVQPVAEKPKRARKAPAPVDVVPAPAVTPIAAVSPPPPAVPVATGSLLEGVDELLSGLDALSFDD